VTTNDTAPPVNSPPDDQAGHPAPGSTDEERPQASNATGDTTNDDADEHDEGDQNDGSRSNREKRYRLRLREAERQLAERDELIARTRQAIVNGVVDRAGYTEKVAESVAAGMDDLLDDKGVPDPAKIADAIGTVTADYGITTRKPRPPKPNQQQGRASGHPGGKASWSDAIKGS
jgi:hypothetical protein